MQSFRFGSCCIAVYATLINLVSALLSLQPWRFCSTPPPAPPPNPVLCLCLLVPSPPHPHVSWAPYGTASGAKFSIQDKACYVWTCAGGAVARAPLPCEQVAGLWTLQASPPGAYIHHSLTRSASSRSLSPSQPQSLTLHLLQRLNIHFVPLPLQELPLCEQQSQEQMHDS